MYLEKFSTVERIYEMRNLVCQKILDREIRPHHVNFEIYYHTLIDGFAAQFRAAIPVMNVMSETVSYPANPLEHFKQSFFPNWLLKKFPVRKTNILIDVREIYKNLGYSLPDGVRRVVEVETRVINERE